MQETSHLDTSEPVVFEQRNSENHTKYTLSDEGLTLEGAIGDETSRTRLLFSEIGLLTDNSAEFTEFEKTRSAMVTVYAATALFVLVLLLTGTRASVADRSVAELMMYVVFVLLGVIGLLLFKFNKDAKVHSRRITFRQGYCSFYYRNPKEKEQVDAFVKQIDQRDAAFYKQRLLEELKRNPQGLDGLLDTLHQKGAIDDTEYGRYDVVIQAANNKGQATIPTDAVE
jgi:hypothetical protein